MNWCTCTVCSGNRDYDYAPIQLFNLCPGNSSSRSDGERGQRAGPPPCILQVSSLSTGISIQRILTRLPPQKDICQTCSRSAGFLDWSIVTLVRPPVTVHQALST